MNSSFRIVHVDYVLSLKARSSGCTRSPVINIPIVIGDVPFNDVPVITQPVSNMVPQMMTQDPNMYPQMLPQALNMCPKMNPQVPNMFPQVLPQTPSMFSQPPNMGSQVTPTPPPANYGVSAPSYPSMLPENIRKHISQKL
jgi:hypothetical protein